MMFRLAVAVALFAEAASFGPGVALTPPMGWSSWNAFHGGINERVIANVTDQVGDTIVR